MHQPLTTATAPSTQASKHAASGGVQVPTVRPSEQAVNVNFHVVIMDDPDTGQPTLCTADDPHESIREATLASVLEQAAAAHKKTDAGVQLAVRHAIAERRSQQIHNPDGTLSEAGQKVLAQITEQVIEMASQAADPLACLDEWSSRFRLGARQLSDPRKHYSWCQPGACITVDSDDGPYTEHQGVTAALPAPDRVESYRGNLVDARLSASEEDGSPVTCVSLVGATGNGANLDGDGLDTLIENTAGFLNQLRMMRLHVGTVQA
ncbi:hypothetical protein ACIQJX_07740 [Streptomyces griseoviridis]